MPPGDKLTDDERGMAHWLFYEEGYPLGEVARAVGCSIYDLSPWLIAPLTEKALRKAEERLARIDAARSGGPPLEGGEINEEDAWNGDTDRFDKRKMKIECPACREMRAPLCSPKTRPTDGGMRWVGDDHREPYTQFETTCACGARYWFTTFCPQ